MTVAATNSQNPQSDLINTLNANTSGTTTATTKSSVQQMQDQFLNLLVTQLKNQDPTNPMDNAQLTSQLAQISTVEGISKLNDNLTSMLTQTQTSQVMQGASLVGHTVLATGDQLTLSTAGTSTVAGLDLASTADKTQVDIYDANGNLTKTLQLGQLDAGFTRFAWDGTDNTGAAAPAGNYTFKVTATAGGTAVDATAYTLGNVLSVGLVSGAVNAEVSGLGNRSMDQIKQIF